MTTFVSDTFSGESTNVLLTSHTGEIGASWSVISGWTSPTISSSTDSVYAQTAYTTFAAVASGVPSGNEYDVEADIEYSSLAGGSQAGIIGRASNDALTFYRAMYVASSAEWRLDLVEDGSVTPLGTYSQTLSLDSEYSLKLEIKDATKKLFVSGVERISSTNNDLTQDGQAGIYILGQATSHRGRVDNFLASDVVIPPANNRVFDIDKIGTIFSNGNFYYPCIIDTSTVSNWPWTLTVYSSSDHGAGGISMYGAVGDPTVPGNWESYDTGLAAGRFDLFGTKPASNPIYIDPTTNDAETPHIVKIGSTWMLTSHDDTGAKQVTRLATATTAPLNFTRYATGSGIIIDQTVSPLDEYPDAGEPHTGYFRWGVNIFPGVDFTYVGYSLFGGGDSAHRACFGSDDGIAWTLIRVLDSVSFASLPSSPTQWKTKITEIDPQSIRDAGNGEYIALCSCGNLTSGATTRYSNVYELYLAADGYTFTREPRLVLEKGDVGSNDEYEVGQASSLMYGGDIICVYQGSDSSGNNSLMLATGSIDGAVSKPDPVRLPNHDKYVYDATGSAVLPSWLEADGVAPTPTATGISIPTSNSGGVKFTSDINPATKTWVELYAEYAYQSGVSNLSPRIQITDTGPANGENGVMAISYGSAGGTNEGKWDLRGYDSTVAVDITIIDSRFYSDSGRKHKIGIQADFTNTLLNFVGNSAQVRDFTSVPNASLPSDLRPRISNAGVTATIIEKITLRITPDSDGIAPIVTATKTSTTVVITISEDCIGDGTGLTIKVDSTEIPGTWSRTSLANLTFTRTTGTFDGSAIDLAVDATDVRNVDLVAIQDGETTIVESSILPIKLIVGIENLTSTSNIDVSILRNLDIDILNNTTTSDIDIFVAGLIKLQAHITNLTSTTNIDVSVLRSLSILIANLTNTSSIVQFMARSLQTDISNTTSTSAVSMEMIRKLFVDTVNGTSTTDIEIILSNLKSLVVSISNNTTTSSLNISVKRSIVSDILNLTSTSASAILKRIAVLVNIENATNIEDISNILLRSLNVNIQNTTLTSDDVALILSSLSVCGDTLAVTLLQDILSCVVEQDSTNVLINKGN